HGDRPGVPLETLEGSPVVDQESLRVQEPEQKLVLGLLELVNCHGRPLTENRIAQTSSRACWSPRRSERARRTSRGREARRCSRPTSLSSSSCFSRRWDDRPSCRARRRRTFHSQRSLSPTPSDGSALRE